MKTKLVPGTLIMRLSSDFPNLFGIYDDLHKAFLYPVVEMTPSFSRNDVEQHLDDVLGVGLGQMDQDKSVDAFFRNYLAKASEVGFKIDATGNTDKVQPPHTTCTALGVVFNTETWTWSLKPDKLARMNQSLVKIMQGEEMEYQEMQSIIGKLIDIKSLVQGGKFNLQYFLQLAHLDLKKKDRVRPSPELQEQAGWWRTALAMVNKHSPIVHPDVRIPSNAVLGYTDAAGGSWGKVGVGVGGLIPPHCYFYLPWPAWLNQGGCNSEGVSFSSKLSCLELLGALVLLVACGDVAVGGHLRIFVDNQGSVDIYAKGHSTKCEYTSAIAKAIYDVSMAVGVTVTVEKIRRCSNQGAYTADMISKGNLTELRRMMPDRNAPSSVPPSIIRWLKDPKKNMKWAKEILQDLRTTGWEVIEPN